MMSSRTLAATSLAFALSTPLLAQQTAVTAQQMDARGKHVMGFDQQKTAHHFRLYEDGGAIEVSVKDTADAENLKAIRAHLPHIATMFADGEFDAPMLVHDTKNVPGAADLARLKARLRYNYVETPAGGRVTMQADGVLDLNGFDTTIGSLAGDSPASKPGMIAAKPRRERGRKAFMRAG